jgi:hypothetical protein
LTRGRAAVPDPFDLSAVSDSDELFEALSTRRLPADGRLEADDPAAALLAALITDVDAGGPPLAAPSRAACGVQGQCRRGARAFVTFGVAALVLTSAGAAAAGGGAEGGGAMSTTQGSARPGGPERSNEDGHRHDRATGRASSGPTTSGPTSSSGRRSTAKHAGDKHPDAPADDASHASEDLRQWDHRGHRSSRGYPRSAPDLHHPVAHTDPYSWTGRRKPPYWLEHAPLVP